MRQSSSVFPRPHLAVVLRALRVGRLRLDFDGAGLCNRPWDLDMAATRVYSREIFIVSLREGLCAGVKYACMGRYLEVQGLLDFGFRVSE